MQVDDGTGQRSLVRSLAIAFDQVVNVPPSAFTITGPNGSVPFTLDQSASNATKSVATLLFAAPLSDGNYALNIAANLIHNLSGSALDGDNNGTAGGNYTAMFHRFFGDADGDRRVNNADFAVFRAAFGTATSVFDFNDDQTTNTADFAQFRARFGTML